MACSLTTEECTVNESQFFKYQVDFSDEINMKHAYLRKMVPNHPHDHVPKLLLASRLSYLNFHRNQCISYAPNQSVLPFRHWNEPVNKKI